MVVQYYYVVFFFYLHVVMFFNGMRFPKLSYSSSIDIWDQKLNSLMKYFDILFFIIPMIFDKITNHRITVNRFKSNPSSDRYNSLSVV